MKKKELLFDFEYLYLALKKHPFLLQSENLQRFEELYLVLKKQIKDDSTLIDAMTALTVFFRDGHTNIELLYTEQDRCLKIACEWQSEGLVLKTDYESVKAGAKIIAVEGVETEHLINWCKKRIPHENRYLVKSRMTEYPYRNYHVFSEENLKRWFGEKEAYNITFRSQGKEVTRKCPLVKYDGFLDFQQDHPFYYEITGDKAVLYLNQCICNEEYKQLLHTLAMESNQRQVKVLELDLSRNMGGSSAVIDEFIKYINVDSFRRYEMIDYSSGSPQVVTRRRDRVVNHRKEVLFPENIICRVSHTTFSSARTFAVTLKDNKIATIIGLPTGGKPCSYGMPKRDWTPNCNIRFRVSRALFLRPDASLDYEETLRGEQSHDY